MNILSWNVNGIRSIQRKEVLNTLFLKGFGDVLHLSDKHIDIIGLQETKATYTELATGFFPEGYVVYHNSATERKGYSGTAVFVSKSLFSKRINLSVTYETLNTEGRLVCVETDKYVLINGYFPNGGGKPERLIYKLRFYDQFVDLLMSLKKKYKKEIVFFGDLNIAHKEIDLARPKENEKHVGFLPEERKKLDLLINRGFYDLYREKYPTSVAYTWWDMKTRSRDRDIGWRIDAFYGTRGVSDSKYDVLILKDILGSDHCPIVLALED
ncbi:MAG: exodeoxyribonuclease [Candidatus Parcubacteria bacterium]|jgi:exodeoxyribonuclease-3